MGRTGAFRIAVLAVLIAAGVPSLPATAQPIESLVSPSDWGGTGLLQNRTARFPRDGHFDVGYSLVDQYTRYTLTLQALPWLEATFRYTDVENRLFSNVFEFSGKQSFKDRGADLKFRVAREGEFTPQVAIGLQDGLGTGIFSGEYVAFSKKIFDFDLSAGLGWGHFASGSTLKNPLASFSDGFKTRDSVTGQGGTLGAGSWFSGANVGLFGGVEYFTPVKGLSLKLEYDPNDYRTEPLDNSFEQASHVNVGLNYRPFPWINLALGYERGNVYMFRASLAANFHDRGIPKLLDPPPPAFRVRPASLTTAQGTTPVAFQPLPISDVEGATLRLFQEVSRRGLYVDEIGIAGAEAILRLGGAPGSIDGEQFAPLVLAVMPGARRARISFLDRAAPIVVVDRNKSEAMRMAAAADHLEGSAGPIGDVSIINGTAMFRVAQLPAAPALGPVLAPVWPLLPPNVAEVVLLSDSGETRIGARPAAAVTSSDSTVPVLPVSGLTDARTVAPKLFERLEAAGFSVDAVDGNDAEVIVFLAGGKSRAIAQNIGRAVRVIADVMPDNIEYITIASMSAGVEMNRLRFKRRDFEEAAMGTGSVEEIGTSAELQDPKLSFLPESAVINPGRYPQLSWSFGPKIRQHIGSADGFYLYQLWLSLSATAELAPGLTLTGQVGKSVYSQFDQLKNEGQSNLPRVRSHVKRYLQEGEDNLVRLQTNYVGMAAPNLYYRVSAGYFEEMFGGYGAEVLYRPRASRWAFSSDVNYVRQRAFDQRFDFLDYTVTTGHLNVYYDAAWKDLQTSIHIGQFLAGDRGAQFRIGRRFDGGVFAGAWFTLTDVPFEDFGEGSFDKGFFFVIPFDLFSLRSSRASGSFAFRPLTRDGGQMLGIRPRLYDVTAGGRDIEVTRDWNQLLH